MKFLFIFCKTEHKPTRSSSNGSIPLLECAGTPTLGQKRSRSEEESTGPKQKKNKGEGLRVIATATKTSCGKGECALVYLVIMLSCPSRINVPERKCIF